jgi:hypothetical protein
MIKVEYAITTRRRNHASASQGGRKSAKDVVLSVDQSRVQQQRAAPPQRTFTNVAILPRMYLASVFLASQFVNDAVRIVAQVDKTCHSFWSVDTQRRSVGVRVIHLGPYANVAAKLV